MYNKLFSPIKIRGLELKNRVVLPAMGTKFASKERYVTDQLIDYHVARAKGGNGLNMVEIASVHTPSAPRGFLSLSKDIYVEKMKTLVDAIHANGAKAGIQLWQGGLAAGFDQAATILLPSDQQVSAEMTLPAMSTAQIDEVIECFAKATKRAVDAGFDCVEVHAAHSYLLHAFLSPGMNRRTDEYGGSLENRMRLPLAVIRKVRENVPDGMPIFMRIDAHDDYFENGLTIEDVIIFCKLAGEAGIDVVNVSRGNILTAGLKYEVPPIDIPRAFNVENAARIRKETNMVTLAVGRINDPSLAEQILADDKADLIGIGRGQLADPDFCNKAAAGQEDDIVRCVACNQGCYDCFSDKDVAHITCMRNPALGKEREYTLKPATTSKKVLIAGGGMAGLELAITLKKRGHNPILCESSDQLGGQFLIAGMAPRKEEMKAAAEHAGYLAKKYGVDIRLNNPVTSKLISKTKPGAFFNAIGATEIVPNITGVDQPFVYTSHNVLLGKDRPSGNVVIIGGGMVGLEAAEYVAEMGCKATVIEMQDDVGIDLGSIRKICIKESLYINKIDTVTDMKVSEICTDQVVGKKGDETITIPCDSVILAVGVKSRDSSEFEAICKKKSIPYFCIGDAAKPRRALNAISEAAKLARLFDDEVYMKSMSDTKKTVFFTGASGTMGIETLKQFISRSERFNIRILVRESKKNKGLLAPFASEPSLEIVWGDMKDSALIGKCVNGADYVLHIGAMVSPMADKYPEETMKVNLGSTLSIIEAIKKQPNADEIGLVYIGTVAQTGCRLTPIHWGRCGDPLKGSMFDYYATSKIASERAVFESGLKRWVSLRQTGILPVNKNAGDEPIIYHQNPNNVLEWTTAIESGILMANVCEDWIPDTFWRKVYNIGSGEKWRFTHSYFSSKSVEPLGIEYKEMYDSRDIAQYNFHGHWYTDSDALDAITHFRCMDPDQFFAAAGAEIKAMKANPLIRKLLPTGKKLRAKNEKTNLKEGGTRWMFENNKEDWIKAFFGSREKQATLKSWEDGYELYRPSDTPTYLNHGYDETKPTTELDMDDMNKAAEFRGGKCLSNSMSKGDLFTPLNWSCHLGHEFSGTPNLILKGGHWCPQCERESWDYAEIAKHNPFFAQVWTPLHGDEDAVTINKIVSDKIFLNN